MYNIASICEANGIIILFVEVKLWQHFAIFLASEANGVTSVSVFK